MSLRSTIGPRRALTICCPKINKKCSAKAKPGVVAVRGCWHRESLNLMCAMKRQQTQPTIQRPAKTATAGRVNSTRKPRLGSAPAPGVAERASRPAVWRATPQKPGNFPVRGMFSARARKTATGAVALPIQLRFLGSTLSDQVVRMAACSPERRGSAPSRPV